MNPERWIQAVFFDMDGTLVDSEAAATEATRLAVADFGATLSKADERAVIGLPWTSILDRCILNYSLPVTPEALMLEIKRHKWEILDGTMKVMPGAVEAVRLCAERVPVAIVSGSYREEVEQVITLLGIGDEIRFIVGAEDVIPGKPYPGPFIKASGLAGVPEKNCLVFEDSAMGTQAARRAGMYVVGVEAADYEEMDLSMAHELLSSLESVTSDWLDAISGRAFEALS